MAEQQGLDYDEIIKKGEELHNQDPSVTIPKVEVLGACVACVARWASSGAAVF